MASSAERLLIARFVASTKELTAGIKQVNSAIAGMPAVAEKSSKGISGNLGRAAGKVFDAMANSTAAVVGGMAAIGGASIKAGKDYNVLLQRTNAAFKTILGSGKAADQMMAKVNKFAKTSPFPRQAFIEATQQMLGFGIEAEKIIPILGAVQDAVAAAGGSQDDIKAIVALMSKIQSTGKIMGDDLNQLGNYGIDAAKIIADATGQSVASVKEQVSKGAIDANTAIDAMTKGFTKKFGGAAEDLKKTWVGGVDRIKGAMRDIGSAIVAPFIDPKGGGYAVVWANKIADLFRALEPKISKAMEGITKKFKPILDKVSPLFDKITDAVSKMGDMKGGGILDGLKDIAPIIAPVAAAFTALGGANIAGALGPLGSLLPTISGPLGAVAVAVGTLVATTPELRDVFKQIVPILIDFAKAIGPMIGEAMKSIMPLIIRIVQLFSSYLIKIIKALLPIILKLADAFFAMLPSIMKLVRAILPLIPIAANLVIALLPLLDLFIDLLPVIAPLIAAVADLASTLLGELIPVFNLLIPLVVKVLGFLAKLSADALGFVIQMVTKIVELFIWLFNKLVGHSIVPDMVAAIIGAFAGLFRNAVAWIQKMVNSIINLFLTLGRKIGALAAAMRDAVVGKVRQLRDWALSIFVNLRDRASGAMEDMRRWISDKASRLRDSVVHAITGMRDRALQVFRDIRDKGKTIFDDAVKNIGKIWGRLEGILKKPISFLINTVINKGLIGAFNWVARKVGAKESGGLHIAGFARGGWTGPGGTNTPAGVVHGDEFVVRKRSRRKIERDHPGWLDYMNSTGRIPGYAGGGKVSLRGKTFTARFAAAIQNAQKLAKTIFSLFQGGFRPATSYSGTSHAGDAVDLGPISAKVVRALRASGIAAWDRTGMGNWVPHIHGVPLPGFGSPAGSAVWQAQNYLKGGNGLGGKDNGAGAGFRPWPITGSQAGFFDLPSWLGKFKDVTQYLKNKITQEFVQHSGWGDNYWEQTISVVPKAIMAGASKGVGDMGKAITAGFKEKFSFDSGGWLPPGVSLAINNTGRPEAIIPPGGLAAQGSTVININVTGALDPDGVARQIDRILTDYRARRNGPAIRSRTRPFDRSVA